MRKNKEFSLGGFLLGSAALVTVAGLALYAYFDEDTHNHVAGIINREKVKAYVRYKLNGSDKLVAAVDQLSDAEVNKLMALADKTSDMSSKASQGFNDIVDRVKEVAQDTGDKVQDFLN
ncbi:hypothetical protein [Facklamia hominis]|uniref:hypothetical protein n=1 Tax=Facklamia hominis TaxID=178214 RepID=UPI00288BDE60|nr:hypothetical protein [Facklamia hominis]WPJ90948.1 hypothetical protein R0V13_00690 [Facklamia hominis]